MKKVLALLLALMMLAALVGCGQGGAKKEEEKSFSFTLGTTSAADDLQTKALERFAANVKEKTDGKIDITVYPASMLGDANAEMEAMIAGTQDMFMESEAGYLDAYGVHEAAAMGVATTATPSQAKTLAESAYMASLREKFRELNGVVTISYNWYRNPIVIASTKKLEKVEDFQGVKLRVVPSEITIKTYGALGFKCTSISYNEVYLSLSQGVVDATICPFDGYYTMKFYEVAPYCLYFGSNTWMNLWMNEAKYNQLSDNQKAIFKECAEEAGVWYTNEAAAARQPYIDACEAAGCQFIDVSDEMLQECLDLMAVVSYEQEDAGVIPKGSYDKMIAASLGQDVS